MKMQCPHCGVKGSLDDSYEGRKMRCPKCTGMFIAEREQALAEEIPEIVAEPGVVQSVAMEEADSRQGLQEDGVTDVVGGVEDQGTAPDNLEPDDVEKSDDELIAAEMPAEVVQEGTTVDEPELSDEIVVETIQDDAIDVLKDSDTLAIDETVEESLLEDSFEGVPAADNSASEELKDEDFDSFEAEQALQNHAESPECAGCGKVAADNEDYLELEGKLYCTLCGPEIQDELLVSAQAAAAVAGAGGIATAAMTPATGSDQRESAPRSHGQKFTVGETISSAWKLTNGVKLPIWGGLLVTSLIMIVIIAGIAMVTVFASHDAAGVVGVIGQFVYYIISTILTGGLIYMGVKRATHRDVSWKDVFSGFDVAVKITIAMILQTILIVIGMFLLILPGIYLMVGYLMTLPLIIDKKMSPWQAMETSRKAIHKVWWRVFGLYIVISLLVMVSSIPAGIGLIWTVPMSLVVAGVVYNHLFGSQKNS